MDPFMEINAIRRGLANGEYSSTEITKFYLDRAKMLNSRLNSFISFCEEQAIKQAKNADNQIADGSSGPITGIPLAHKDIFCTKGIKTTCGSRMLENFIAPYNATVVERLNKAGVVTIGKANMDEFAMGSSNETSYFGSTSNPWDIDRVPGGSSGGSAAAVAAGMVPIATGTDTGGSIRQPAAFCGISGLKPTYGRVSRYGMIAFASSLDQAGVLARSVADICLLLSQFSGPDALDSTSHPIPDNWLSSNPGLNPTRPEKNITIGLPKEYFDQTPNLKSVEIAMRVFENAGCILKEVSLPSTESAIAAYYIIAGAEASTNLSRYDGVRFGYRCQDPESLEDLYQRSRNEGFGKEVKRRILTGTYALSVGYYDAYYLKAQKIRRIIQQDFLDAYNEVDLLLCPTSPGIAFKKGGLSENPVDMYKQDIFTIPSSLAGLPAMSIPCGFQNNMPVGMQLIAPHFAEKRLIEWGHYFQSLTDWHKQVPELS